MGVPNSCSIYVVFGKKKAKIPVNPEELSIKMPTDHKTYEVLGAGQVVVQKKPSLKEVSWEGFFPGDTGAPYVNSRAKPPEYYVKQFEKALKDRQKCRLIISRSGLYDTNMRCIVSSFEVKDRGGEPDDIYYSIELLEYRQHSPEVVAVVADAPAATPGSIGIQGSQESPRPVEEPVMRVGAAVVVNGAYCNDSYGSKPHGHADNIATTVRRIVSGNPYPILVGHYGWVQEGQLQITG
ncbi:hypothetical protein D3Z51_09275 [Clostridiaceae bacterium]|nr:hypothetical protein [Clostridiaceae bacterium]RKI14443.1 hypothetical protein D7V81_08760 [bacterium 1XD21-70]